MSIATDCSTCPSLHLRRGAHCLNFLSAEISSGGARRFEYDGDRLIMEYDNWGSQLRSYAWGPGTDEPLVWYEVAGGLSRRFLHADHQGSIVAAADQAGNALAINAYDPWGIPNAGNVGRFGYTGQSWIPELGMYYYKARIYSPMLGRFIQTDPIGYKDQVNLYSYVANDPVSHVDPAGKEIVLVTEDDPTIVAGPERIGRRPPGPTKGGREVAGAVVPGSIGAWTAARSGARRAPGQEQGRGRHGGGRRAREGSRHPQEGL